MKVISCLKNILPPIISYTISAFAPVRLTTNNILISYETFHSVMNQYCQSRSVYIKLDASKTYNQVECLFHHKVMIKLGFKDSLVDMVMMSCVGLASFSSE